MVLSIHPSTHPTCCCPNTDWIVSQSTEKIGPIIITSSSGSIVIINLVSDRSQQGHGPAAGRFSRHEPGRPAVHKVESARDAVDVDDLPAQEQSFALPGLHGGHIDFFQVDAPRRDEFLLEGALAGDFQRTGHQILGQLADGLFGGGSPLGVGGKPAVQHQGLPEPAGNGVVGQGARAGHVALGVRRGDLPQLLQDLLGIPPVHRSRPDVPVDGDLSAVVDVPEFPGGKRRQPEGGGSREPVVRDQDRALLNDLPRLFLSFGFRFGLAAMRRRRRRRHPERDASRRHG
mmetsp:Transcript_25145/g.69356  ORF Transcript_25145/g.69356 Transcript_25145/m.69356 type:complete len:288 (+) Transcript_25145:205-1068(+)